jgi:hypothetical protein
MIDVFQKRLQALLRLLKGSILVQIDLLTLHGLEKQGVMVM